jgi:hypothetical protein
VGVHGNGAPGVMGLRENWEGAGENRRWFAGAAVTAVVVVAVFLYGLCAMVGSAVRWLSPPPAPPDVLVQVISHDADAGLVALFAKYCMKLILTATPSTTDSLRQCVTLPPDARTFNDPPATVTDLDVYPPQLTLQHGDVSAWSVLVAATVKPFVAPAAARRYYWLSVALPKSGGPRAIMLPDVRAASLPPGADMELDYPHDVRSGGRGGQRPAPLYDVVSRFLTAYLCGPANAITNYVTADSRLGSLGQLYSSITINAMRADLPADGAPQPGDQTHVLVTITARDRVGTPEPMQYPLLVVESGGRWAVSALQDLPALTGRILPPGK